MRFDSCRAAIISCDTIPALISLVALEFPLHRASLRFSGTEQAMQSARPSCPLRRCHSASISSASLISSTARNSSPQPAPYAFIAILDIFAFRVLGFYAAWRSMFGWDFLLLCLSLIDLCCAFSLLTCVCVDSWLSYTRIRSPASALDRAGENVRLRFHLNRVCCDFRTNFQANVSHLASASLLTICPAFAQLPAIKTLSQQHIAPANSVANHPQGGSPDIAPNSQVRHGLESLVCVDIAKSKPCFVARCFAPLLRGDIRSIADS